MVPGDESFRHTRDFEDLLSRVKSGEAPSSPIVLDNLDNQAQYARTPAQEAYVREFVAGRRRAA